jgi:predicted secreted protein
MLWTSVIAIYALFWVLCAFIVLPIGVRTHDEAGIEKIPGQADSAPANFRPGLIARRATLLSLALFGLFYANYVYDWLGPKAFDFIGGPPNVDGSAKNP